MEGMPPRIHRSPWVLIRDISAVGGSPAFHSGINMDELGGIFQTDLRHFQPAPPREYRGNAMEVFAAHTCNPQAASLRKIYAHASGDDTRESIS